MTALLLDTCVLVDLLRRNRVAEEAVAAAVERPCVCHVSTMELYGGVRSQREEARIDAVLETFLFVRIDAVIFRRAGSLLRHYRASHATDVPAALVAATAEHHGLRLATINTKHFPMFPKLKRAY